jgi:hypothetical protein
VQKLEDTQLDNLQELPIPSPPAALDDGAWTMNDYGHAMAVCQFMHTFRGLLCVADVQLFSVGEYVCMP